MKSIEADVGAVTNEGSRLDTQTNSYNLVSC